MDFCCFSSAEESIVVSNKGEVGVTGVPATEVAVTVLGSVDPPLGANWDASLDVPP